ncbi:MAG: glycosyltransferase family 2 protein [Caldicoprobacterales bacterium]|jgi:glycosyltransferase involved in cell wall biosynthesis|nr:glycosyltransferase family 2 protein [Clostridiales bacterium]
MEFSIIIPAFNEENNIPRVLEAVHALQDQCEILVVNDGSVDYTSDVVRSYGISVHDLPVNRGKGYAMWEGLQNTSKEVIVFLDADLIGLQPEHVLKMVGPISDDLADMTVGIFTSGRGITDLAQKLTPFLSGQRAIRRSILEHLDKEEWISGYGIEIALTRYVREHNLRLLEIPLDNVSQTIKEEKLGLAKGMKARLKMYWEIAKEINRV